MNESFYAKDDIVSNLYTKFYTLSSTIEEELDNGLNVSKLEYNFEELKDTFRQFRNQLKKSGAIWERVNQLSSIVNNEQASEDISLIDQESDLFHPSPNVPSSQVHSTSNTQDMISKEYNYDKGSITVLKVENTEQDLIQENESIFSIETMLSDGRKVTIFFGSPKPHSQDEIKSNSSDFSLLDQKSLEFWNSMRSHMVDQMVKLRVKFTKLKDEIQFSSIHTRNQDEI